MIVSSRELVLLASTLLLGGQHVVAQGQLSADENPLTTTHGSSMPTTKTKTKTTTVPIPTPEIPLAAEWQIPSQVISFNTDAFFNYRLDYESVRQFAGKFGAVLAQTNAIDGEPVTTDNSWSVVQLVPCAKDTGCSVQTPFQQPRQLDDPNSWANATWKFERNEKAEADAQVQAKVVNSSNFFLCFGTGPETGVGFTCRAFSDLFTINPDPNNTTNTGSTGSSVNADNSGTGQGLVSNPPLLPTGTISGTLSLSSLPPYVTYSGIPAELVSTAFLQPTETVIGTIVTATPSATSNAGIPLSVSTTKKLSTGAIVGIALGSLVLVSLLAVLAVFFCIRRRRRAQSAGTTHEKAMLTRNNARDSGENDNGAHTLIHPNSNDSALTSPDQNPLIPADATAYGAAERGVFRDNTETLDLHDSVRAAPSSSLPSSSPPPIYTKSSPPRRKPTNASTFSAGAVSALSRNPSSATMNSSTSFEDYHHHHNMPHDSRLQNIGEEEGSVRYGEAPRRTTQIFDRGSSASPFVSEGMSVEEVARLEDEERRIDAAIAAAEQARGRVGGGGSSSRNPLP